MTPSTPPRSLMSTMERTTQTEPRKAKKWKQVWLCFLGDDNFRKQRQREATEKSRFCKTFSLNCNYKIFLNLCRWWKSICQ